MEVGPNLEGAEQSRKKRQESQPRKEGAELGLVFGWGRSQSVWRALWAKAA